MAFLLPFLLGPAELACAVTVTPQPIPGADGMSIGSDAGSRDMGMGADGTYHYPEAAAGPDGALIQKDLGSRDGKPETSPVCGDWPCPEGPPLPPETGAGEAGAGEMVVLQPDCS